MSSLNSRLKVLEDEIVKMNAITEEKVNEIVATAVKSVHERAEEIAQFTGVDEDKTPPNSPQVQ